MTDPRPGLLRTRAFDQIDFLPIEAHAILAALEGYGFKIGSRVVARGRIGTIALVREIPCVLFSDGTSEFVYPWDVKPPPALVQLADALEAADSEEVV